MNASLDAELATLNVSEDCWETKAISKHMGRHKAIDIPYSGLFLRPKST